MNRVHGVLFAAGLAAAALFASSAFAGVVLTDNFDAENGGATALNYTGFAKWTVLGGQRVDLIHDGDHGTSGSGSYVDLDGTSGPGQIYTKQVFAFDAGDLITINFDLSGSQRAASLDSFYAGLFDLNVAGNGRTNTSVSLDGVPFFPADVSGVQALGGAFSLPGTTQWSHGQVRFNVANAGNGVFYFGTFSADNVGPLLDNVSISIGSVPEPSTWALAIGGFGLTGAALRRRRLAVAG